MKPRPLLSGVSYFLLRARLSLNPRAEVDFKASLAPNSASPSKEYSYMPHLVPQSILTNSIVHVRKPRLQENKLCMEAKLQG